MAAAFLRALSAHEERPGRRGPDYLAEIFLPRERRDLLRDARTRDWVLNNKVDAGSYALLVARTAFFDKIVADWLASGRPQVVFLGAGYDTRPYRFGGVNHGTRLFEVDARPTQDYKRQLLKRESISIPPEVTYVGVDFEAGELLEALLDNGFDRKKTALFIWEGVTYYLTPTGVDDTLNCIRTNSPAGSPVCFDFASVPADPSADLDAARRRARMRSRYPGEPTRFGIREGELDSFLSKRGFSLVEELSAHDMDQRYLTSEDGMSIGPVPTTFHIAYAMVSS